MKISPSIFPFVLMISGLIGGITLPLFGALAISTAFVQDDSSWRWDKWISGGNWVSSAMMGMERPDEERIEEKLHEIERLVKEIRQLNKATPRQPERLAP